MSMSLVIAIRAEAQQELDETIARLSAELANAQNETERQRIYGAIIEAQRRFDATTGEAWANYRAYMREE